MLAALGAVVEAFSVILAPCSAALCVGAMTTKRAPHVLLTALK